MAGVPRGEQPDAQLVAAVVDGDPGEPEPWVVRHHGDPAPGGIEVQRYPGQSGYEVQRRR